MLCAGKARIFEEQVGMSEEPYYLPEYKSQINMSDGAL